MIFIQEANKIKAALQNNMIEIHPDSGVYTLSLQYISIQ